MHILYIISYFSAKNVITTFNSIWSLKTVLPSLIFTQRESVVKIRANFIGRLWNKGGVSCLTCHPFFRGAPTVLTSCHESLCFIHLHINPFQSCNHKWYLAFQLVSSPALAVCETAKTAVQPTDEKGLPLRLSLTSDCNVRIDSYPVSLHCNFGYERYYTVRSYWPCHSIISSFWNGRQGNKNGTEI